MVQCSSVSQALTHDPRAIDLVLTDMNLPDGTGLDVLSKLVQRRADLRYYGQEHTVSVPVSDPAPQVTQIEQDFHAAHEQMYTFQLSDTPIEFVNFHVAGFLQVRQPEIKRLESDGGSAGRPNTEKRMVDFDVDGVHETTIYKRDQLPVDFAATGPLIVEESASTTLVHPVIL